MKRHHTLIAATLVAAGIGGFATAAMADCASELNALSKGGGKDATLAPLSDSTTATPQTGGTAKSPDEMAKGGGKDGSKTPMNADPNIAMSGQDAQAQSEGGQTAAAQAQGAAGSGTGSRQAALDEARAALASGDEDACMAAVQRAKGM